MSIWWGLLISNLPVRVVGWSIKEQETKFEKKRLKLWVYILCHPALLFCENWRNRATLLPQLKAGVNLKFAQKLSFLFSSEFAALGIQLRCGKIIFYLFSLFLPFWAISKFPLWLMVWLPWQREEHFLIFQLFMMCYSGNQAPKRAGFNERYFM